MTFRRIAIRNIRQSWHRYSAYFLSSVFSVGIFFVYASFIYHPDVLNNRFPEGSTVSTMLYGCEVLIFMFSVFFTWYSSGAFLRYRKRELGMYILLGMNKWQLRRMVLYEQLFISMLAIVTGIGCGLLLSKLFYLMMGRILIVNEPLSFYISIEALSLTMILFVALFLTITVFSLRKIGQMEVIDLLRTPIHTKKPPVYSWGLVIISVASLTIGYYLAIRTDWNNIQYTFLPTVFWTILGTYFFYTQASVFVMKLLTRSKKLYYRGINLLNISKSAYRLRENARVLFSISILSTVVLTATSTVYVIDKGYQQLTIETNPFDLTIAYEVGQQPVISSARVHELVKRYGHQIQSEASVQLTSGIVYVGSNRVGTASVMGMTSYNDLRAALDLEPVPPMEEGAIWVDQGGNIMMEQALSGAEALNKRIQLSFGEDDIMKDFYVQSTYEHVMLSRSYALGYIIVIPDDEMQRLHEELPADLFRNLEGYRWSDWRDAYELSNAIMNESEEAGGRPVTLRLLDISTINQSTSLILFIGLFVSMLFFIASGSIIYFKLFSDLQEDQAYFRSLIRVGMSYEGIRKVVYVQIGLVFLLPCVVGSVHMMVAMITLSHLLFTNIMGYSLTVVGIYVMFQMIYFIFTSNAYIRLIQKRISI